VMAIATAMTACATGTVIVHNDEKISAPKEIVLDAPNAPWVAQIETRLRQKGFKVKRIARNERKALDWSNGRYVLALDGSYMTGWGHRCFGGGHKFDYLNAELLDLKENESLLSVSGEGYSENCPPASGTIYEDITAAVAAKWR
jgi:hypothetical protein